MVVVSNLLLKMGMMKSYEQYTKEYNKFLEEMAKQCRCIPPFDRPCISLLQGGLCEENGFGEVTLTEPDFSKDDLEWSEDYE